MEKGYSVIHSGNYKDVKFILVDNYIDSNQVVNYITYSLNGFVFNNSVGVWKIKNKISPMLILQY